MGILTELVDDRMQKPEQTPNYRRGYVRGALAMLEAAEPYLPKAHALILRAWAGGALMEWSASEDDSLPPPPPSIRVA